MAGGVGSRFWAKYSWFSQAISRYDRRGDITFARHFWKIGQFYSILQYFYCNIKPLSKDYFGSIGRKIIPRSSDLWNRSPQYSLLHIDGKFENKKTQSWCQNCNLSKWSYHNWWKAIHWRYGIGLGTCQWKYLITFGIQPDFPSTGFGYVAVDKDQKDSKLKRLPHLVKSPIKQLLSVISMIKINSGIGGYLSGLSLLFWRGSKHMPTYFTIFSIVVLIFWIPHPRELLSRKTITLLKTFRWIML